MKHCKQLIFLAFGFLFTLSGQASSWQLFINHYSSTNLFFFDAETVVKQADTTTIWIKSVINPEAPNPDAIYATSYKYQINCKLRNFQILTSFNYDKDGKFIMTYPNPGDIGSAKPGSILDGIITTVCTPDFPNNKSGNDYASIPNNDVFKRTADYFSYLKASSVDPAPK